RAAPELGGRLESVEVGHPDVHQHDVDVAGVDGGERVLSVAGLDDDRDVLGAAEDHGEPGTHEGVVIDDRDADRAAVRTGLIHEDHGSEAVRTNSWSLLMQYVSVPPLRAVRSDSPTSLRPERGVSVRTSPTRSGLRISTTTPSSGPPETVTRTSVSAACLRALVSPS